MYHELTANEYQDEAKKGHFTVFDWLQGKPLRNAMSTFNERVRGIGTRFKIDKEDGSVLEVKAVRAVEHAFGTGAPTPPPVAEAGTTQQAPTAAAKPVSTQPPPK